MIAVLLSAVAFVSWMDPAIPMALTMSVHSFGRQEGVLSAFLLLTNTGAVPLAVPLRFDCQVEKTKNYWCQ
jgi:hypothetical protein